jgi:non-lysosomal glucosylceramidase
MKDSDKKGRQCRCGSSDCGGLGRRQFVKTLAVGAASALAPMSGVMAGPFQTSDFEKLIPANKKLHPDWVKALFLRGQPAVYRGRDLDKIGMPVGGICAGQLYLGGDGTLWHWDIFNKTQGTGDAHYAHPPKPQSPVPHGFVLETTVGGQRLTRRLDRSGFCDISFRGEYPIGYVEYRDPQSPVAVSLEVFSPFIPLNADDSSLPATILQIKIKNTGQAKVETQLSGFLGNAVCCSTGVEGRGQRQNRALHHPRLKMVECSVVPKDAAVREEIVIDDFQKETYAGWDVEGTAFGSGPILKSAIPGYQGDVGGPGKRVVNSHAAAPGSSVGEKDQHTGKLTSRPFTIQRKCLSFWIGGGNNPGKTCVNLLVDGKVVSTATGRNDNRMRFETFDVRPWQGKTARLEIVDQATGSWGNIGVGRIAMTDRPAGKLQEQPDFGTMVIGLLGPKPDDRADCEVKELEPRGTVPFSDRRSASASENRDSPLLAALTRSMSLEPGQEATATYVIAWHFPNLNLKDGGRHYATRFPSAVAVADYVAEHFDRLAGQTRLWHNTWYDSTLPYWFLDRTFLNTSILATSTCHWFKTGRFYGWEGVGCCEGTCTHVWHYAHAVARIFPQLERDLRRRTDFGTAQDPRTGMIQHRGESCGFAADGQAGCILRVYREHQMSPDGALLAELWPKIKLAMRCLINLDRGQGLLEGAQHNTLDQPWFGKIAWLSSLYVAAAKACEEMACELGDEDFAREVRRIVHRGGQNIDRELFNGEYYIQVADKEHAKSVGSHDGCEIDQVFGQSWSHQLGMGRILSEANVKRALASLWKYNFTPDVGPYRRAHQPGRWYAMPGEGGLVMCTWPKGEAARLSRDYDFYLNECMTGFEYQVAGHMIWEGMVKEGLAIARAIHDRYHPSRRNPWNEVECGDHYARAMASYGVFLAACGYEYHGPKGRLGFAPRLAADDFRAAFTTAEGWGTYSQKRQPQLQRHTIAVKYGRLRLRTLSFALDGRWKPAQVTVAVAGAPVEARHELVDGKLVITLAADHIVKAGQELTADVSA